MNPYRIVLAPRFDPMPQIRPILPSAVRDKTPRTRALPYPLPGTRQVQLTSQTPRPIISTPSLPSPIHPIRRNLAPDLQTSVRPTAYVATVASGSGAVFQQGPAYHYRRISNKFPQGLRIIYTYDDDPHRIVRPSISTNVASEHVRLTGQASFQLRHWMEVFDGFYANWYSSPNANGEPPQHWEPFVYVFERNDAQSSASVLVTCENVFFNNRPTVSFPPYFRRFYVEQIFHPKISKHNFKIEKHF
jgi:hypothetical protein